MCVRDAGHRTNRGRCWRVTHHPDRLQYPPRRAANQASFGAWADGSPFASLGGMALRIDLLGRCEKRDALVARLLEKQQTLDFDQFVRRAAESTSAPIALISLMGRRSQFFAASRGLPPELQTVGGTDRSVSLCQRVVRDNAPMEWEDASADESAPQGMVEAYGIRSYLGVPVVLADVVVGSLCIVDTVPRSFSPQERATLNSLGAELSAQLTREVRPLFERDAIARQEAECEAIEPCFGELRNLLSPLMCGLSEAALSNAELQGALRLFRIKDTHARARLESVMEETLESSTDLAEILGDLKPTSQRLARSILAMESLFDRSRPMKPVSECLSDASTLAEHLTKLVGGVHFEAPAGCLKRVSARTVIPAVALLLGTASRRLISRRTSGGLNVSSVDTPEGVSITIRAPNWAQEDVEHCVNHSEALVRWEPSVTLRANSGAVMLTCAAAP